MKCVSGMKIIENEEKKLKVAEDIDEVISVMCGRIKSGDWAPELYEKNARALAMLVWARAQL